MDNIDATVLAKNGMVISPEDFDKTYTVWMKHVKVVNPFRVGGFALEGTFLKTIHSFDPGMMLKRFRTNVLGTPLPPHSIFIVAVGRKNDEPIGGVKTTTEAAFLVVGIPRSDIAPVGAPEVLENLAPDINIHLQVFGNLGIVATYKRADVTRHLGKSSTEETMNKAMASTFSLGQNPLTTVAGDVLGLSRTALFDAGETNALNSESTDTSEAHSGSFAAMPLQAGGDVSAKGRPKDISDEPLRLTRRTTEWSEAGDAPYDIDVVKGLVKKLFRRKFKVLTEVSGVLFLGMSNENEHQPLLLDIVSDRNLSVLTEQELHELSQILKYQEKKLHALTTQMRMARLIVDGDDVSVLRKKEESD